MYYNICLFFLWIIASVFILAISVKKKYSKSLPARFFLFNNPPPKASDVHFHLCSLGEVRAMEPFIKEFNSSVSVITQAGYDYCKTITTNCCFLPFEIFLPFYKIDTKILVIFEAELWLNLVKYSKKNGVFVVLLNARISDRTYNRYKFFKFYYKHVFKYIDLVLAQSQKDADRLVEIGANNVEVFGNIKSDIRVNLKNYYKKCKKIIVIASTHEKEEILILNALDKLIKQNIFNDYQIILAPRHSYRFKEVGIIFQKFATSNGKTYSEFSHSDLSHDCILVDTFGCLVDFFAICDLVILGGSFVKNVGGHNPMEAAIFGSAIVTGEYIFNQRELFSCVKNVKFANKDNLCEILKEPLLKTSIINHCDSDSFRNIILEKLEKYER